MDQDHEHWHAIYEKIIDSSIVEKLLEITEIIGNSRKVHVFCQRAIQDLTGSLISVDGNLGDETIDAINFAVRSGMAKQLKMTVAHYAANYIQLHVSQSDYQQYLIKLFK